MLPLSYDSVVRRNQTNGLVRYRVQTWFGWQNSILLQTGGSGIYRLFIEYLKNLEVPAVQVPSEFMVDVFIAVRCKF